MDSKEPSSPRDVPEEPSPPRNVPEEPSLPRDVPEEPSPPRNVPEEPSPPRDATGDVTLKFQEGLLIVLVNFLGFLDFKKDPSTANLRTFAFFLRYVKFKP